MKVKSQAGFALLHLLLVLIIIIAIIGTGWYVWQSKKETDAALQASNKAANSTTDIQKTTDEQDETASWLLYTAPSGNFSMRLADGWMMSRYMKSDALYAFGTENVIYKEGTKATVTEVEGGRDGSSIGLFVNYFAKSEDATGKIQGEAGQKFKTRQGVEVTTYTYTETAEQEEGIGGLPKGGKLYSYIGQKGDAVFLIYYGIGPSDKDEPARVEQAIKTFEFK